jgi:hypothetical protein
MGITVPLFKWFAPYGVELAWKFTYPNATNHWARVLKGGHKGHPYSPVVEVITCR